MKLADDDIQEFIFAHEHDDETKLVLRSKEFMGVPTASIADQIKARRKARIKLPLYYKTHGIVYPPSLNLEQSSSEATAIYKREIIQELIPKRERFCDLTGGFGVDSFFISSAFAHCDFVEPNATLLEMAKHNHALLGARNITYHNTTAEEFSGSNFDLIYVDPSRRDKSKNKVVSFSDSEPRVSSAPPRVLSETKNLLIKASPLLDLQQGVKELGNVSRVYVVARDNEVKELLFFCNQNVSTEPDIICVDISASEFRFKFSEEREVVSTLSDADTYLDQYIYEPNASIMKGGAFKSVATRFNLNKIETNTHLYTSDSMVESFPGRIFKVVGHVKPDKSLKEDFPKGQANILLRNYPMSVEELKKKTGITEGGTDYLIGFSGRNKKYLVKAEKVRARS